MVIRRRPGILPRNNRRPRPSRLPNNNHLPPRLGSLDILPTWEGGWDGVDDYYGAESRVGDGSWEGDFEGFGSVGY
jgi:hypothetical protein